MTLTKTAAASFMRQIRAMTSYLKGVTIGAGDINGKGVAIAIKVLSSEAIADINLIPALFSH